MKAWMGEFIGSPLLVTESAGISRLPFQGTVVDETMNMFYLEAGHPARTRALPKKGLRGVLSTEVGEIPLIGDELRVRPEDRIKRWATRRREGRW